MSEATIDETDFDDSIEEESISEYTTETPSARPVVQRDIVTAPGAATGRRKEAVARVRLVPGTGKWTINGRDLDGYFPNKVHQQEVNEPFVVLGAEGLFDVIARIHGGGISGQAGALRLGVSRALNQIDLDPAFRRWRMDEAVRHHSPEISLADCTDRDALVSHCERL